MIKAIEQREKEKDISQIEILDIMVQRNVKKKRTGKG